MLTRCAYIIAALLIQLSAFAGKKSDSTDVSKSSSFAHQQFGLQAGPGVSIFYNQHPLQNPRTPGKIPYGAALVGFSYQYNFTPMVGLRMETNWQRTGDVWYDVYNLSDAGIYTHSYAYENLNYLTMPITLKLSFGKAIKFFTNTGVYGGLLINGYRVSSDYYRVPGNEIISYSQIRTTTDVSNDIRRLDGGVVMGLGASFPLGHYASFTFEARDNLGLVNLNKGTGLYGNNFHNNSANFLFGLNVMLDRPNTLPAR